jgi:acylphosphatase
MTDKRAHVFVSGRVQGVSFRYYTVRQASDKGVRGWVRNLADGRVEAMFEGPQEKVEAMVQWCHQGPPAARVSEVEVEWSQATHEWSDFHVRY